MQAAQAAWVADIIYALTLVGAAYTVLYAVRTSDAQQRTLELQQQQLELQRRELAESRQQNARAQAAKVTFWYKIELTTKPHAVILHNASESPVYRCVVFEYLPGEQARLHGTRQVLEPTDRLGTDYLDFKYCFDTKDVGFPNMRMAFRDSSGELWIREYNGELHLMSEQEKALVLDLIHNMDLTGFQPSDVEARHEDTTGS